MKKFIMLITIIGMNALTVESSASSFSENFSMDDDYQLALKTSTEEEGPILLRPGKDGMMNAYDCAGKTTEMQYQDCEMLGEVRPDVVERLVVDLSERVETLHHRFGVAAIVVIVSMVALLGVGAFTVAVGTEALLWGIGLGTAVAPALVKLLLFTSASGIGLGAYFSSEQDDYKSAREVLQEITGKNLSEGSFSLDISKKQLKSQLVKYVEKCGTEDCEAEDIELLMR